MFSYFGTYLSALNFDKIVQSCENKNYKLCSALGTLYFLGIEVEKNTTKSIVYNMIACRGDIKYCKQFEKILVKTKVFKLSNKKLLDYSNLACDLNDPNSCYFIGNYFLNDKNATNDKLGLNLYKKSCKLGHAKGCYETGMKYYSEIVERKDYINVNKYLKKSCEGNFSFACFNLGVMYEKGLGIDKNLTNAKMYYNKACAMENMPACFNLALSYEKGVKTDYIKMRKLLEKTCKSKNSLGCYDLANMYLFGKGVAIDYDKARGLYEKSCNAKESNGCNNMGYIYENGLGVEKNYIQAKKYYNKSCRMGNKLGCSNLDSQE